jgi:outer membrane protein
MRKSIVRFSGLFGCAVIFMGLIGQHSAMAESMDESLALAYANNPELNAQRAATRAIDENVPIAKSALRPQIFGNAEYGKSWSETAGRSVVLEPYGFGVTISQTLFDSFRTRNNVASAKAGVRASREVLRNTEQNVIFDAASAYMNVIRDRAIANYRSQALEFLNELVRSEQARFDVGESTRTDVAQAEASREAARSLLSAANAQLQSSRAIYRQVIGIDPRNLRTPRGVTNLLPKNTDAALAIAFNEHPAILATRFLVDQADWEVRSAESELLPIISLDGRAARRYNQATSGTVTDSASITATLTVPIYQGGGVSASVRQNKEILGQRRIEVDQAIDDVRTAIVSAYSQLEAAQASSSANQSQLRAAQLALDGMIEERNVGQRTTLDVLQAQQDVISAQIDVANSQRDIVVAGYAALSAAGRLDAERLNLAVMHYDPVVHYRAVKDKWFGLRTPDVQ